MYLCLHEYTYMKMLIDNVYITIYGYITTYAWLLICVYIHIHTQINSYTHLYISVHTHNYA
jgi:hypothetical protein